MARLLGGRATARSNTFIPIDNVTYDANITSTNSVTFDCSGYQRFRVILTMVSVGTPTNIQFIPQFSDDGGTTFYSFLQGIWASMFFEDTVMATEITEVYTGEVAGASFRLRAVATGTSGTATFRVTAKVEFIQ